MILKQTEPEDIFELTDKRATGKELEEQAALLSAHPLLETLINASCDSVIIMNENRQMIMANEVLCSALNINKLSSVLGKRPGELFNCEYACNNTGGCGTASACKDCGAFSAIRKTIQGSKTSLKECRIKRTGNLETLDLLVKTAPLKLSGHEFIICSMIEISHEKRRRVLERVFFHDIQNSAGCIDGLSQAILESNLPESQQQDILHTIRDAAHVLMDEIAGQKLLIAAENRELPFIKLLINSSVLINQIVAMYKKHAAAEHRYIKIAEDSADIFFYTDSAILKRIVSNMLKNALEASDRDQTVTIGCEKTRAGKIRIYVHNQSVIPKQIQAQIFKRSFSTKGDGRGIGTYSMKLLGEKYLNAKVAFRSSTEKGTMFWIILSSENDSLSIKK